jgi:hypothetical protein
MVHARAIGVVAIIILCGCSHKSGVQVDATSVAATADRTVPRSSSPAPDTASPPATNGDIALPPPEPAAVAPTKASLADPATSAWLNTALTVRKVTADDPCATTPAVMEQAVAGNVVMLNDVVLSELLVNLDSALGGVGLACTTGDIAAASSELADAQAAANAVASRLEELNR